MKPVPDYRGRYLIGVRGKSLEDALDPFFITEMYSKEELRDIIIGKTLFPASGPKVRDLSRYVIATKAVELHGDEIRDVLEDIINLIERTIQEIERTQTYFRSPRIPPLKEKMDTLEALKDSFPQLDWRFYTIFYDASHTTEGLLIYEYINQRIKPIDLAKTMFYVGYH